VLVGEFLNGQDMKRKVGRIVLGYVGSLLVLIGEKFLDMTDQPALPSV